MVSQIVLIAAEPDQHNYNAEDQAFVVIDGGPVDREKREAGNLGELWEVEPLKFLEMDIKYPFEEGNFLERGKRSVQKENPGIQIQLKEVKEGKILQSTRHPNLGTAYAISQTIEMSKVVDREQDLQESLDNLLEVPRFTSATISENFDPVGKTGEEVRILSERTLAECQVTCIANDAKVLADLKVEELLLEKNPELSVWFEATYTYNEMEFDVERGTSGPLTIATIGGRDIGEECLLASTYVSLLGDVGILLPWESNKTNFILTSVESTMGIFHTKKRGEISKYMWDTEDHLDFQHHTRYPPQDTDVGLGQVPPLIGVIPRPVKYEIMFNASGCFAVVQGVALWARPKQLCVCQKKAPKVTTKEKDSVRIRRLQRTLLEEALARNKEGGKDDKKMSRKELLEYEKTHRFRVTRETSSNSSRYQHFEELNQEIISFLKNMRVEDTNILTLDSVVETIMGAIDELVGVHSEKVEIPIERLGNARNISEKVGPNRVKKYKGGLKFEPGRKLIKIPIDALNESVIQQSIQTTAEAIFEMQDMKDTQNSFYRGEILPSMPKNIQRIMKRNGEKVKEAVAVIYEVELGVSQILLLFMTEQWVPYQRPSLSYLLIPRYHSPEGLFYTIILTDECKKWITENQTLDDQSYQQACPEQVQYLPSIFEVDYPEEEYRLVRFLSRDPIKLHLTCSGGMDKVECKGICVLKIGYKCKVLYEGISIIGGELAMKTSTVKEDKVTSEKYQVLYNEQAQEKRVYGIKYDVMIAIIMVAIGLFLLVVFSMILCYYLGKIRVCTGFESTE